jgi:hypothetical protein
MATQSATGDLLTFTDGTYLYGESPLAGTVGALYFVFTVEANQLSGAVYQPSSSFDCVRGHVGEEQLNLIFPTTFAQPESSHTVAFTPAGNAVAGHGNFPGQPGLEGMHPINTLSELDMHLLETCAS